MHFNSLLLYLRQIRAPYLSTAPAPPPSRQRTNIKDLIASPTHLTDLQRSEIDTQTSTLLHDLSSNISSLTAAEQLRTSTETVLLERRFGKSQQSHALWRWAAGSTHRNDNSDEDAGLEKSAEQREAEGRANGMKVFREGVLWYLGWKLQGVVEVQRGMVEVRAAREREREKSVLWLAKGEGGTQSAYSTGGGGGQIPRHTAAAADHHHQRPLDADANHLHPTSYNPAIEYHGQEEEELAQADLPASLLPLLATENTSLLQHLQHTNSTLAKITQAESSLLEISSLQSTLLSHLSAQGEMISHLVDDAAGTEGNVQKGNRELKRAGERWGRGLARGVFWGTVVICGVCVGWDLVF